MKDNENYRNTFHCLIAKKTQPFKQLKGKRKKKRVNINPIRIVLSSTRSAHKYYALLHTGIYFLTVRISLHILYLLSMIESKNIL